MVLAFIFIICSCDKERKPYNDVPQIAFERTTYTFNVSSTTTSVTIPVQLIAGSPQGAINANIAVNSASNCANAVTTPVSVTIDSGRFIANLVITINHANLNAGNANKLLLDLTATGIKVAGNYKSVTITLNKQ